MRHFLTLCVSLILIIPLWADNVSVEDAQSFAQKFFQQNASTRSTVPQFQLVWDGSDAQTRNRLYPAVYVFNRTDANGFIIISGDDITYPVLGYSTKNSFFLNPLPDNVRYWIEHLEKEINYLRSLHKKASPEVEAAWDHLAFNENEPLVKLQTALWNQDEPYNRLCPQTPQGLSVSGCVATAMGIIMKYYEWPDKGVGTIGGYTTSSQKLYVSSFVLGHEYDWANMPLEYKRGRYTEAQAEAVARLIYDCGVMAEADYSASSTGALTHVALHAMVEHMKYDKSVKLVDRDNYNLGLWDDLIRKELDANRPVLYGGVDASNGGHQFIIDGYTTDDYFSINWGWGGQSNGNFLLSTLNPSNMGIGGGNGGGFRFYQNAVINLCPDKGGDYETNLVLAAAQGNDGIWYEGLSSDTRYFQTGKLFTLNVAFVFNYGLVTFDGDVMVGVTDKDGTLKEILNIQHISGLQSYYGTGFSMQCQVEQPIARGDRIRVFYKKGEDWVRMDYKKETVAEIVLREEKALDEGTSITFNKADRTLRIQSFWGTSYKIWSVIDNSVRLEGQLTDSDAVTVCPEQLPKGQYILELSYENEKKAITLIL
ncbi:C10 family peptidase [uncultured Mediterranea sp.]|uniref:C10 family peptidase n=1 Tax=uncultured Mediterranea sp. TaxID=1926662 RepID=UPI0028045EB1|nr:C10 family peptidase [uncultured Mediterranea sp.]